MQSAALIRPAAQWIGDLGGTNPQPILQESKPNALTNKQFIISAASPKSSILEIIFRQFRLTDTQRDGPPAGRIPGFQIERPGDCGKRIRLNRVSGGQTVAQRLESDDHRRAAAGLGELLEGRF
jgi:hypothetical protein